MTEKADAVAVVQGSSVGSLLPTVDTFDTMARMAKVFFESGLMPDHIKSAQAAFAVMQKGLELGIPPMQAIGSIYVIGRKPSANSELMLGLIYREHGDNAMQFVTTTADICTIAYKRRGWEKASEFSYTKEDAALGGVTKNPNFTKFPAAMLRARCISSVARMAFPDVIGGMHTPEELGAQGTVTIDGEFVVEDATPQRQTQVREAPKAAPAPKPAPAPAPEPIKADFTLNEETGEREPDAAPAPEAKAPNGLPLMTKAHVAQLTRLKAQLLAKHPDYVFPEVKFEHATDSLFESFSKRIKTIIAEQDLAKQQTLTETTFPAVEGAAAVIDVPLEPATPATGALAFNEDTTW